MEQHFGELSGLLAGLLGNILMDLRAKLRVKGRLFQAGKFCVQLDAENFVLWHDSPSRNYLIAQEMAKPARSERLRPRAFHRKKRPAAAGLLFRILQN